MTAGVCSTSIIDPSLLWSFCCPRHANDHNQIDNLIIDVAPSAIAVCAAVDPQGNG